jgi:hypothetical protein
VAFVESSDEAGIEAVEAPHLSDSIGDH